VLVNITLVALAVPVIAWTSYLAALAMLSWLRFRPIEMGAPLSADSLTKFDVIVPAHNEEVGIAATVRSLRALDYPPGMYRVVVVADNCTDATATRAAEAGAEVLERKDVERRGKGYALAHAFEQSLLAGKADAVVVVDADTTTTPNLLRVFDALFRSGAKAIQAEYRVANRDSWRTRLMHIGFTLFHDVRSRAREQLKVSVGLRGNGMAFSLPLLREVPHEAFSIVEDVEYGIRLGRAGHRVHYAGEAQVFGEMVASGAASRSQRERWEGGRWALARRHAGSLLGEGVRRPSLLLLDLAADLLVPPLTYVVLAATLGFMASASWVAFGHGAWWAVAPWLLTEIELGVYIVRGVWLARVGPRVVLDLLWAPVYMIWKVALATGSTSVRGERGERGDKWVRTARRGDKP
jgi:1,2-diacylglycerol 3-beta-glucosyltransferase